MKNQLLTNQKVDRASVKITDQTGRRITNVGAPVETSDAVRLQDLNALQTKVQNALAKLGVTL